LVLYMNIAMNRTGEGAVGDSKSLIICSKAASLFRRFSVIADC
jgi:hypothetical protein